MWTDCVPISASTSVMFFLFALFAIICLTLNFLLALFFAIYFPSWAYVLDEKEDAGIISGLTHSTCMYQILTYMPIIVINNRSTNSHSNNHLTSYCYSTSYRFIICFRCYSSLDLAWIVLIKHVSNSVHKLLFF